MPDGERAVAGPQHPGSPCLGGRAGDGVALVGRADALPWQARAGNELRAAGLSARAADPGSSGPATGRADLLAPLDRRIAELAAAGLTNKQIGEHVYLSHRTVAAHLYQIFPRLGITSRAALRDALDELERLDARPWQARAENELRAAGLVSGLREAGPARAASLTPQEYEVAVLAAAGLTNKHIGERLYLSHRTVAAHLYQAFPKLGVSSRAALRDALAGMPRPADR
jgi:DNA-binding NarL/FixJ family response regulator